MTVSHAIVILLTLTCQLTPKSNSHISLLLLRLYINYSIFNAIHFTPTPCTVQYSSSFNFVQQCIQISTRINSSSVHTYIFVCSTLRVILQGFVTQNATTKSTYIILYPKIHSLLLSYALCTFEQKLVSRKRAHCGNWSRINVHILA